MHYKKIFFSGLFLIGSYYSLEASYLNSLVSSLPGSSLPEKLKNPYIGISAAIGLSAALGCSAYVFCKPAFNPTSLADIEIFLNKENSRKYPIYPHSISNNEMHFKGLCLWGLWPFYLKIPLKEVWDAIDKDPNRIVFRLKIRDTYLERYLSNPTIGKYSIRSLKGERKNGLSIIRSLLDNDVGGRVRRTCDMTDLTYKILSSNNDFYTFGDKAREAEWKGIKILLKNKS